MTSGPAAGSRLAQARLASPRTRQAESPTGAKAGVHERKLGRALLLLRDAQLYRALGYVRLGDYLLERLGVSLRTAQELMRTSEALAALPVVAAAFERGEITSAHVRLLTRVATAVDEEMWVARARRRSVRQLARDVAVARREAEGLVKGDGSSGFTDTALAARMIDPDPVLFRFKVRSPAWIAAMWREVRVRVRRLAGGMLPAGACLEALLAESPPGGRQRPEGHGDELHACACEGGDGPEVPANGSEDGAPRVAAPEDSKSVALDGRLDADSAVSNTLAGRLSPDPSSSVETSRSEEPPDAREVDRELRTLVAARQADEARLADALADRRKWRAHVSAGYASLEAFALERYGVAPRRLYYMLALHRDLSRLPVLRLAFVGGQVRLRQALLVARVSTTATAEAWIRRAESVTLRRLEDEADFWMHLRDTRYEVWRLLKGRPLPDGIVLEPGKEPRLHASARAAGSTAFGTTNGKEIDEARDDLHASARPGSPMRVAGAATGEPGTPPRASDFAETVTAEALLAALEADEGLTPLPERMCDIEMYVEPEIFEMWNAKVAELRASIRPELQEWEVLALLMHHFVTTWDNKETRRQARENPILERGGWRCAAPGCRSVGSGNLQTHHVKFKSAGGEADDPSNETGICVGHHLDQIHRGLVRCTGRAPDDLIWEMGLVPGHPERGAFQVFAGDVLLH